MLFQARRLMVPPAGSIVTVGKSGLPRYWATVWGSLLPADLAPSTVIKKHRYVDKLYDYTDRNWGSDRLDDALWNLDLSLLCDMVEGYFLTIRNSANLNAASDESWRFALQFVLETCRRISRNQPTADELLDLEGRLRSLELLTAHLHIGRRRGPERIRSLPASVLDYLYQTLDPESSDNPFTRGHTKWLVYVLFMLLLHQGLRHGEALILPTDAVKNAFDRGRMGHRYWISVKFNEYENDPRYSKPSIKNEPSIRQVPASETIALVVQEYATNHRGRANHSFLLNSQKKSPLSKEGVRWIFGKISASLPPALQKEMFEHTDRPSITPHHLRHTCAVVRLNQLLHRKVPMDEALQQLRTFFGWSRESDMPLRYSRAVFEDRLSSVWDSKFDEEVDILRSIPQRVQ